MPTPDTQRSLEVKEVTATYRCPCGGIHLVQVKPDHRGVVARIYSVYCTRAARSCICTLEGIR